MMTKDDPYADEMVSTPTFASLCEQFANRDNGGLSVGADEVSVRKEPQHDGVHPPANPGGH
jgi:hypothetical protein